MYNEHETIITRQDIAFRPAFGTLLKRNHICHAANLRPTTQPCLSLPWAWINTSRVTDARHHTPSRLLRGGVGRLLCGLPKAPSK